MAFSCIPMSQTISYHSIPRTIIKPGDPERLWIAEIVLPSNQPGSIFAKERALPNIPSEGMHISVAGLLHDYALTDSGLCCYSHETSA